MQAWSLDLPYSARRVTHLRHRRSLRPLIVLIHRPFVAVAVLLGVYVVLSFANDPGGFLGTDTGGKVATLRAMEAAGRLDPDVGYWAERWDPEGRLHPLYYTLRKGDRWVNVSTLPALYAGYPLYRLGGYRLALLVPMAGSVLAALGARALARRLGGGDGWSAFWLVGLASPLTVYALDFWEHSLGAALVVWAVVLLVDASTPPIRRSRGNTPPARWVIPSGIALGGYRRALAAGALFGIAATMRQEALVYAAGAAVVTVWALLTLRRMVVPALAVCSALAAALVIPLAANLALERVTVGSDIRGARATGTASGAGDDLATRVQEGALTALALDPDLEVGSWLVGAAAVALIAVTVRRAGGGRREDLGLARVAFGGAVALYGVRAAGGLGFVPGMLAATPIAAVGLAAPGGVGWRVLTGAGGGADLEGGERRLERRSLVLGVAVLAVPVVWAFQYPGGASPQWGGRYVLPSGLLLSVLGAVALSRLARWARTALVALAVGVTLFGLAWLSVRSHQVARAAAALEQRSEPVIVARWAHLAREGGAFSGTVHDRPWLTAVSDDDLTRAGEIVRLAGLSRFAYVDVIDADAVAGQVDERDAGIPAPPAVEGFAARAEERLPWISGLHLRVVTYERVTLAEQ